MQDLKERAYLYTAPIKPDDPMQHLYHGHHIREAYIAGAKVVIAEMRERVSVYSASAIWRKQLEKILKELEK